VKLLDLHLRAYGPFTDRHLDLSEGQQGLHVVFGLNEAGKSSALRALRALLYGIPERTQDDFLHGKTDLRVGGRFRDGTEEDFVCYRRKGRKNTLLDADDRPIAEDVLKRLLGGVDERLFEHLFAIDHASLVSGGQSLMAERGREAEALFGTGLGSTAIHSVLDSLDQEAQDLFLPKASKPLINAKLKQLGEITGRLRDVSLPARQWDEARKGLNRAQKALAETDAQLAEASRRCSALERIRRTLPGLARRAELRDRLDSLGAVPVLADDFGQRREAATSKRSLAAAGRVKAKTRLEDLKSKAAALDISEDLLAEAESIDALREQLGSHRKAVMDRPELVANLATREGQARQRLAEVRPDLTLAQVDRLRPLLARRRRVTDLGGRKEALETAARDARARVEEAEGGLALKRGELEGLPEIPPFEALRRAVQTAHRAGDIDRAIEETRERVRRHEAACERDLKALGLWSGDLAALVCAPLPSEETLRRFSEEFLALDNERRSLEQVHSDADAERERTEESMRALELTGTVPSEAALLGARAHRDEGWRLLKHQWIEDADVTAEAEAYEDGADLPDAFERAVTDADEVADRLRREAQRVHEQATMQARREACAGRLAETETSLADLTARHRALEQSWQQLWRALGIDPLPPREMADWLGRALHLREKAAQGDELRAQVEGLCATRDVHRRALSEVLTALREPVGVASESDALRSVLGHAESRLDSLEKAERRQLALREKVSELADTLQRLECGLRAAEAELAGWQSEWSVLLQAVGIAENASPGEVSDYLQSIAETLSLRQEATDLQSRIAGIDADARRFGEAANDLLTRLAPDLLQRPIEEAVLHLHARLAQQREAKSRGDELTAQASRAEQDVREAEADIRAAEEVLGELCRQAGCEDPDQLLAVERRHAERLQLAMQLREVEAELIEGGDGLGIAALEAEVGAADRDAVLAELASVNDRITRELRPEREKLLEQKVNAERDFAGMAGGDAAGALAEEAQQTLSSLRAHAERYVRVKLAGRILRDEIERFRRQHRDPILSRTSRYFQQLTCGSFSAVDTDFDESDQPVLVGVRPDGQRLRVEGMSTGTCDQLYLALRLATLEHYMDSSEPLPFIVDDILIQFDDERARATLEALADFSAGSQVILFTHHGRVAEQAVKLAGAVERVFLHELG
jgi:uncharacterized protein YhaN